MVEQATHLVDLARHLAGDADESTVQTQCVRDEGPESVGNLSKVGIPWQQSMLQDISSKRVHCQDNMN